MHTREIIKDMIDARLMCLKFSHQTMKMKEKINIIQPNEEFGYTTAIWRSYKDQNTCRNDE
jgi:hypothetical protein